MNIILNGKNYSLEENFTVQKLLKKLEEDWLLDLSGAVVLVNDEIVKKDRWEESKIFENVEIEVLSFVSGG